MPLIGILVNVLILAIVLLVIYYIISAILKQLGHPEWDWAVRVVLLLVALLWFLAIVGLIPGGGPIIKFSQVTWLVA